MRGFAYQVVVPQMFACGFKSFKSDMEKKIQVVRDENTCLGGILEKSNDSIIVAEEVSKDKKSN